MVGTRQGLVFGGSRIDCVDTAVPCQGSTGSPEAWRIMPGRRERDAECPCIWPRCWSPEATENREQAFACVRRNSAFGMGHCDNMEDGTGVQERGGESLCLRAKRSRQGSAEKWPKTQRHVAAKVKARGGQGEHTLISQGDRVGMGAIPPGPHVRARGSVWDAHPQSSRSGEAGLREARGADSRRAAWGSPPVEGAVGAELRQREAAGPEGA